MEHVNDSVRNRVEPAISETAADPEEELSDLGVVIIVFGSQSAGQRLRFETGERLLQCPVPGVRTLLRSQGDEVV